MLQPASSYLAWTCCRCRVVCGQPFLPPASSCLSDVPASRAATAAAVHNNLFTAINTGLGARTFNSGGNGDRGANSAANSTWWNVRPASGVAVAIPDCSFGPLLNFFGAWLEPGPKRGLLQAADGPAAGAVVDALVSANAVSPYCTKEGWFVEQLDKGKSAFPWDLHRAQLLARQQGSLK